MFPPLDLLVCSSRLALEGQISCSFAGSSQSEVVEAGSQVREEFGEAVEKDFLGFGQGRICAVKMSLLCTDGLTHISYGSSDIWKELEVELLCVKRSQLR